MPKFDPGEDGLFIGADGVSSSAPWKLAEFGNRGALAEEEIQSVAARFELDPDRLKELSRSLGIALAPPTPSVVPLQRSVAAKRADKEIGGAFKEIGTAEENLFLAIRRLEQIDPGAAETRADCQQFLEAKQAAMESHRQSLKAYRLLDKFHKTPGKLLVVMPDGRLNNGTRRHSVLVTLFSFWLDCGRKLGFTTDPINNSKRSGQLIDFVNTVIGCLSDPPGTLGSETIIRELRAFRRRPDPASADRMVVGLHRLRQCRCKSAASQASSAGKTSPVIMSAKGLGARHLPWDLDTPDGQRRVIGIVQGRRDRRRADRAARRGPAEPSLVTSAAANME